VLPRHPGHSLPPGLTPPEAQHGILNLVAGGYRHPPPRRAPNHRCRLSQGGWAGPPVLEAGRASSTQHRRCTAQKALAPVGGPAGRQHTPEQGEHASSDTTREATGPPARHQPPAGARTPPQTRPPPHAEHQGRAGSSSAAPAGRTTGRGG